MLKQIFIYLSLILFLFSCKKKEEVDNDPNGTPIENILPSDSSSYQALFSCVNFYAKNSGSYTPNGNVTSGYYSSQLIIKEVYSASNLQNMGTVILNSIIFKNKSAVTNFYYHDTTNTQFALPHVWEIYGTPSISTFSYSNYNSPPTFTASSNIPDSISLSTGFTIPIKGTTDCAIIRVFVQGGSGSTTFPSKLYAGTDTLITLSANDLQGLTTTNTGYISVQLYRDAYRTIGGKRINFRSGLQYSNAFLKIKP